MAIVDFLFATSMLKDPGNIHKEEVIYNASTTYSRTSNRSSSPALSKAAKSSKPPT
jgi:hypothetical protein